LSVLKTNIRAINYNRIQSVHIEQHEQHFGRVTQRVKIRDESYKRIIHVDVNRNRDAHTNYYFNRSTHLRDDRSR